MLYEFNFASGGIRSPKKKVKRITNIVEKKERNKQGKFTLTTRRG